MRMTSTPDILDVYTDYIELDSDDLGDDDWSYQWEPACWDDCETCGCHGLCDRSDPWDEWYPDDEEEDD